MIKYESKQHGEEKHLFQLSTPMAQFTLREVREGMKAETIKELGLLAHISAHIQLAFLASQDLPA